MLLARCRIDATDSVLVHAAGEVVTIEVYDDSRKLIARGQDLARTLDSPMCRLRIDGNAITREDFWPTDADHGAVVLLAGGEAGVLKSWWNAGDHNEWRWQVEFYNSRG